MKVGTIKLRGQDVEVHASHTGWWAFQLPVPTDAEPTERPTHLSSGTDFEKAKKAARRRLRELSVPVAVPFVTYRPNSDGTFDSFPAIAKGIHMRTNEILVWIDDPHSSNHPDGYNTTFSRYSNRVLRPTVNMAELVTYTKKTQKLLNAQRRLREWWDANTFELNKAVKEAIDSHMDTLDPEDLEEDTP